MPLSASSFHAIPVDLNSEQKTVNTASRDKQEDLFILGDTATASADQNYQRIHESPVQFLTNHR